MYLLAGQGQVIDKENIAIKYFHCLGSLGKVD